MENFRITCHGERKRQRMKLLQKILVLVILLLPVHAWTQDGSSPGANEDKRLTQLLDDGSHLATSGKPNQAIEYFEKVAASYEEKFRDEKTRLLFCARWSVESLRYLVEAANEKRDAKIVSSNWAYAYYLKAYSLQDLGRVSEAKVMLERALALSPRNSQFLSELASIYQREKNWPTALQTYQLAEAAAREFSPPKVKDAELSRAWRGMGFVLVEQNRLDEAEKMYRQCLELNKNDSMALNELRYILNLKAKKGDQ